MSYDFVNDDSFWKKLNTQVNRAMSGVYSGNDAGREWNITIGDLGEGWRFVSGYYDDTKKELPKEPEEFIPIKIIYNCPATICYFPDGTKVVVICPETEEYSKELGVMHCIIKKIFKVKGEGYYDTFKRTVDIGTESEDAIFERLNHNGILKRSK